MPALCLQGCCCSLLGGKMYFWPPGLWGSLKGLSCDAYVFHRIAVEWVRYSIQKQQNCIPHIPASDVTVSYSTCITENCPRHQTQGSFQDIVLYQPCSCSSLSSPQLSCPTWSFRKQATVKKMNFETLLLLRVFWSYEAKMWYKAYMHSYCTAVQNILPF